MFSPGEVGQTHDGEDEEKEGEEEEEEKKEKKKTNSGPSIYSVQLKWTDKSILQFLIP